MRAKHDSEYAPASSGSDRAAIGGDPDGLYRAIHADRDYFSAEDAAIARRTDIACPARKSGSGRRGVEFPAKATPTAGAMM